MTKRRNCRFTLCIATAIILGGLVTQPLLAQGDVTLRVTNIAVINENPRGDSLVLGTLSPGAILQVLDQQGPWYLVQSPDADSSWRRGWIHNRYIEVVGATAAAEPVRRFEERTSVRGFGQIGLIRFTASDSFETVTGSKFGIMYGGGAQVALRNGLFVQGSVERYQDAGQRVFVFRNESTGSDEVFPLGIRNTITVTPIQVTAGYRQVAPSGLAGYVGAGGGVHLYKEESEFALPADNIDEKFASYHILGGAEWPLWSWLWLGGEGQWSWVPDAIGEGGVSAARFFDEDDLGGFTLRFKLSVGY